MYLWFYWIIYQSGVIVSKGLHVMPFSKRAVPIHNWFFGLFFYRKKNAIFFNYQPKTDDRLKNSLKILSSWMLISQIDKLCLYSCIIISLLVKRIYSNATLIHPKPTWMGVEVTEKDELDRHSQMARTNTQRVPKFYIYIYF